MNVGYGAARAILWSLGHAPNRVAEQLARFYVRLFDLALPRLRRTGYRNLSFALPNADKKRTIDGVFHSLARVLIALSRFEMINKGNVTEWISYEGLEHYEEAKRRGRGVLFATAHLGNWELSAFAHALLTEPMNIVVRPLDNAAIDGMVERLRGLSGNIPILKKEAARKVLQALARNEAVGILIDQNVSPAEGVFVDFFGKPACTGTAFAKMAAHSGAAVIPGFALWLEKERRYLLRFLPIVEITGNAAEDTARIHRILEQVIREHPDQWLWIHRRWKTRPPGDPAFH